MSIYKRIVKYSLIIVLLVLIVEIAHAQNDFEWWNNAHNWDGYTHWSDYIIFSPYYMGPNALSVPESEKGRVKEKAEFSMRGACHTSPGDQTQDIRLAFYYPFLDGKIAVDFGWIPLEAYNMDYPTILERRTRYLGGSGAAQGDFYFSTIIQLVKNRSLPDLALRMACRTASGTNLGDARFTDAPGYYFDISAGKNIPIGNNDKNSLRIHGMAGFYSWQMNMPNNPQNDAILYGAGVDLFFGNWFIDNAFEGYSGYFGNDEVVVGNPDQPVSFKDRPLVYRIKAGRKFTGWDVYAGFQKGLNDFPYTSYFLQLGYFFNPL